jgi:adenine-specific DNA-methyltransferase
MPTLDFKGKQFVHSHHLSVPFRELRVDAKKSLPVKGGKASLDDNLIIHGDNLEALKALLPTHAGKVDCIFIDPPYNTGNEGWCYNDNVRSPLMKEWLKKSANPVDKEDLERHDKWLCMMWPRLQLLRELLAEDGMVFMTIDDNEQHRFRCLLDEVFGEEQFIANIVWQKAYSPRMDAQGFSKDNDHLLLYGKGVRADFIRVVIGDAEYTEESGSPEVVRLRSWRKEGSSSLRSDRPNLWYPIPAPDKTKVYPIKPDGTEGRWRGDYDYFQGLDAAGKIEWTKRDDGWHIYVRQKVETTKPRPPSTWWDNEYAGHNHGAAEQIKNILGPGIFQTPKPLELLRRIIEIGTDQDSVVLDSFAGSGTTAHAVLEANQRDSGERRFILIQLPEETAVDSPANKAGYHDVGEITAERVRRVIQGYKFTGNQRTELLSEKLTWTAFKKAAELLEKVESISILEGASYDSVKKEIKDGVLTVTGERKIEEKMPGLGGSFTYCELGDPIDIESLLTGGAGMPSYEALARYVFYTATGRSLEKVPAPKADGFIGETEVFRLHLIYKPDKEWLRSNDAALDAKKLETIEKGNKAGKRAIVFAVAKFMSQKELSARRIEFCQLPYAVHKILGD